MPALKLEEIESKQYRIVFAPNTGGCFFIEQFNETGLINETNLFTGSEGLDDYRQLKRAWRKSQLCFDSLCAEYLPPPILKYITDNQKGQ